MSTSEKTLPVKASINIKALAHQMERVAMLEADIKKEPPDETYLGSAKLAKLGIFRIVVMGEIKKGKSSFINALTGNKDLVPVHSNVATSTIYKIHYGPEIRYTVYFNKETAREKLVIDGSQINEYGTEDGNPDNVKNVDFIRVESPSPILRNGLVIVDTPGVGGLFKKHREIPFKHAPNADAVFFVTDSVESPIGADEVKFLKDLRHITPLITFVQTKSCQVEEVARTARMKNNISILTEHARLPKEDIAYFIVDSNLKMMADKNKDSEDLLDSGFGPLLAYLNNSLRRNQEANIAKAALTRTRSKLYPLEAILAERKRILEADTTEKRAKIESEITELQTHLTEWEKTSKPKLLEEFHKGLASLTRKTQEELRPLQPGGVIQSEFDQEIERATSPDQVKALLEQVDSDLSALTSAACHRICIQARDGVIIMLERLSHDVIATMVGRVDGQCELSLTNITPDKLWVNTGSITRTISRQTDGGVFENARTAVYGGMAGVAIASIVGGIVGSVIPIVGTIAGSWVGATVAGIWGGATATSMLHGQKLDALKRESYMALQQALSHAYQAANSQVNNLISDMQVEAASLLQKMMQQANESLAKKRTDLTHRQKTTQQEIVKEQKAIVAFTTEFNAIEKSLEKLTTLSPV